MDAAVAASFTERNVRLLQALAAIEDHGLSDKPDDSGPDLTRLDFKINLLLDLVGQLVGGQSPASAAGRHPLQCPGSRLAGQRPTAAGRRARHGQKSICATSSPSHCG